MLHLSRIDKATHTIYQSYFCRTFNIGRLLLHFFPDPNIFRALQHHTATLISGAQALYFFERIIDLTAPLDLYLFPGRERDIGEYLLSIGYEFVPSEDQLPDFAEQDARGYRVDPRPDAYPMAMWREGVYGVMHEDNDYDTDDEEAWVPLRGVRHLYEFVKHDNTHHWKDKLVIRLVVCGRAPIETILNTFSTSTS
jgi:hypothetical protein